MTKKIYFLLLLVLAGMAGVNAQVRISGSEAPNRSAVLDLNPDDRTSEGNATKGLALPRVRLKNTTNPYPLLSHVKGMTVYNLSAEGDVTPGVYTADGSRWIRQADSESLENLTANIYSTVLGDTIVNYLTQQIATSELGDSILEYITQNVYHTALGDSIVNLVYENERDGIVGNSQTRTGSKLGQCLSRHEPPLMPEQHFPLAGGLNTILPLVGKALRKTKNEYRITLHF